MGRTTDELGDDHEGYVDAELAAPVQLYEGEPPRTWTLGTSTPETRAVGVTGRHRASCSCGWHGPARSLGVMDEYLPEALEDQVLEEWEAHIAPLIGLGEMRSVADSIAAAQRRLTQLVADARKGGSSWAEIASALGVTKQAAQQRYG